MSTSSRGSETCEDRILYWNRSAERIYWWTREEALGRNGHELLYRETGQFDEAKRAALGKGELGRHSPTPWISVNRLRWHGQGGSLRGSGQAEQLRRRVAVHLVTVARRHRGRGGLPSILRVPIS